VAQPNVSVAMRDGVKLATDLYFPARDGAAVRG
jgi:predicted acyl esterase